MMTREGKNDAEGRCHDNGGGREYQISARWRCFSDMVISGENAPIIK
jgi:hypothetical protein